MKRKWHIRTRLLVMLTGLSCLVLIVTALAFNLSVNGYIHSRISAQLNMVSKSTSEMRSGIRGPKEPFQEHPDMITGTRGSAVILDENGSLASNLHGDNMIAQELATWYRTQDRSEVISNKTVTLSNGTFTISTLKDPVEEGRTLLVYVDITAIHAFAKQINLVLLLVIAASVLLSVILSRRFAKAFASPIQTLSDFASEIGSGDLTQRELSFRDAELQQLARSMNDMVQELKEAKQKQETFFQNVSHELRTPLTSIRGNAEGIVYGIIEPMTAGKVILSESDKLSGMVEDILYLSTIKRERGTSYPYARTFNFGVNITL